MRLAAALAMLLLGCKDRKLDDLERRVQALEGSARGSSSASTAQPPVKSLEDRVAHLEQEASKNAVDDAAHLAGDARSLKGKKVTIGESQTGAEACAAQHLDCVGVATTEARDANGVLGGYFVPDCYTRILKQQCLIAGGTATAYTYTPGKFARITPTGKKGGKDQPSTLISPVSNSLCLETAEYDYAICVGF